MEIAVIQDKIYEICGVKVMLDFDLALLYQTETRVLKQAVRRNLNRFPADFIFKITQEELTSLRSRFVTSSWGGTRYAPSAFTEEVVAMLSSVVNSERAIEINISIIRAFIAMRQFHLALNLLKERVSEIEKQFPDIYKILNHLVDKKKKISRKDRLKLDTNNIPSRSCPSPPAASGAAVAHNTKADLSTADAGDRTTPEKRPLRFWAKTA